MTNGIVKWRVLAPYAVTAALLVVAIMGNVASTMGRGAAAGQPPSLWVPMVDELTSAAAWLAVLPIIIHAFRSFVPPRRSMILAAPVHLALIPMISLGHFVLTRVLRALIFAAQGESFVFRFSWSDFAGDFYKDVLNYFLFGLIGWGAEQLFSRHDALPLSGASPSDAEPIFEVRDGAQTFYLPIRDILWVEAAGNYVEIHATGDRTLLMRATLGNVAERLEKEMFLRIHRSRLVNLTIVTAIENMPAGESCLTLVDGTTLIASRTYRARVSGALRSRATTADLERQ